jgi:hypothetical protein
MTAAIVNAWGDPRPADELERAAEERQSEHNLHSSKRAVPCETCGSIHAGEPGQLWEREAERDERSVFDTLSDRWLDVVFPVVKASWARETRSGAATMETAIRIGRGEPAGQLDGWRDGHPHYRMHSGASGVIVSGQRRKVTARYIHTGFECGAL